MRCGRQRAVRVTPVDGFGWQHERALLDSRHRVEDRLEFPILDLGQLRGLAGCIDGSCGDDEDRLADVLDQLRIQDLLVVNNRTAVVLARDVIGDHDVDDAGGGANAGKIEL